MRKHNLKMLAAIIAVALLSFMAGIYTAAAIADAIVQSHK